MASVKNVTVNAYVGEPLNFSAPAVTWDYTGIFGPEDNGHKEIRVYDGAVVRDPNPAVWPNGIDGVDYTQVVVTYDAYSGVNPPGATGYTSNVIAYIPTDVNNGILSRELAVELSGKQITMYALEDPHYDGAPRSGFLTFNVVYPPPPVVSSTTIYGVAGTAMSYQINATFDPYVYSAAPLPDGLTLDPIRGIIAGTPTKPGTVRATAVAEDYGGDGTGIITFVIESDILGVGNGAGAFGMLEVFDLDPSTGHRVTSVSVEGGGGGAGAGGFFNEFIYEKNVPCLTPVYTQLTASQPLPIAMQITFEDYFQDDVRLRINDKAIQDWQRCGEQVDGIIYFGPMKPGDVVSIDYFAQCAPSGRTADWKAEVYYMSGNTVTETVAYSPPLTNRYFQNTGYSTLSPMWSPYGSFTIGNINDATAWTGSLANLLTIFESTTGNVLMYDEDTKPAQYVANGDEYITDGVKILHHFRADEQYKSMVASRSTLNYRFKMAQVEDYDPDLMIATGLKSDQQAWISYDVRTGGFQSQVLQGYAIALIDNLTGNSIKYNDGGSMLIGNDPSFISGFCQQVGAIIDNTGSGCQDPDDLPDTLKYCLTGSGQADIESARSGILEIMKSFGQDVTITLPDIEDFGTALVTGSYFFYTGAISYGQPETGDTICFTQYVFGDNKSYNDEYSGTFGHLPPYPAVDFCLTYGEDYFDITGLANALNGYLSGAHHVWYQFPCTFNQYDGYYEETGIMTFEVTDPNTISFKSTLVGLAGKHDWKFAYTGQREITEISYLLPSTVLMQGSHDNQAWDTLHSVYDIDWLSITPTTGTNSFSYFLSGGHNADTDQQPEKSGGAGVKGVVAIPVGTLTGSGNTKCGTPFLTTFDLEIPIDPSGCPEPDDDDKDDDKDKDPDPNAGGQDPNLPGIVTYSQLKTGWKFDNDIPYNFYRIYLDQFTVAPDGDADSVSGFFAITNINLFGTKTGDEYLLSDVCLIGADYSVDIEAQTTGIITGILSGHASAATSGKAIWDKVLVTGVPNGDGRVRFQTESGYASGAFQALITAELVGSGWVTDSTGGFFVWDSGDGLLLPPPEISGYVTGCGMISGGPYNIVGNNGVPYSVTGQDVKRIVSGLTEYVVNTYTFPVTGYIPHVGVPGYNIPAFAYLTGVLSGTVTPDDSGYYLFNQMLTGVPPTGETYSYVVDHYDNMQGTLFVPNTATMTPGDRITINGTPLIYTTGDNSGPNYFSNLTEFNNAINNNPSGYGIGFVSGVGPSSPLTAHTYAMEAVVSGIGGNIPAVVSKGNNPPTFTVTQTGVTYYQHLEPISVFQGNINQQVAAVSYFENVPASGYVSGFLDYISQIRTFTGIWGLRTGLENYLSSGWVTSGYIYERPDSLPVVVYNSPGAISMTVIYNSNAPTTSPDVATLRISGVNFPKYIEFNITGHQ